MPGDQHDNPLDPLDLSLLAQLGAGNEWLRRVLCTLARKGLKFQRSNEPAANAILDCLATWPWYKAGQFLFDLLEWEDFMLDGPPPELLHTTLDPAALGNLTQALRQLQSQLDGSVAAAATAGLQSGTGAAPDDDLPELASSQYLFQYVALGVWQSLRATANTRTTT